MFATAGLVSPRPVINPGICLICSVPAAEAQHALLFAPLCISNFCEPFDQNLVMSKTKQ
jgi:hypothetical protein